MNTEDKYNFPSKFQNAKILFYQSYCLFCKNTCIKENWLCCCQDYTSQNMIKMILLN